MAKSGGESGSRHREGRQPAPHWVSCTGVGSHCTCLTPVKHISPEEIKIKDSKLPGFGQTLWLSRRQKTSSFREVVKEATKFSPGTWASPSGICGCFLSGRPHQVVRTLLPGGPGNRQPSQMATDTELHVHFWSCFGKRLGMGGGKLSVPSHQGLNSVPKPREGPSLTSWSSVCLGKWTLCLGLLRTVVMSTGTRVGAWKVPAGPPRWWERTTSLLSWIFHI